MSTQTTEAAQAAVCNYQHYFEVHTLPSGHKSWVCVRCLHAKPFGG